MFWVRDEIQSIITKYVSHKEHLNPGTLDNKQPISNWAIQVVLCVLVVLKTVNWYLNCNTFLGYYSQIQVFQIQEIS